MRSFDHQKMLQLATRAGALGDILIELSKQPPRIETPEWLEFLVIAEGLLMRLTELAELQNRTGVINSLAPWNQKRKVQ
jgi:hypothetical protein